MKKLIIIFLCTIFIFICSGCGVGAGDNFTSSGRFVVVSASENNLNAPYLETIIADRNTGVLYLVVYVGHHFGITPIIDSNGKPMLWREESE